MDFIKKLSIIGLTLLISIASYGQEIKLMSFNIGSSNWLGNRDSVIARIVFNNPDVLCAIEATGNTRIFLESSLSDYHMLQTFGNSPNTTESHIFYRKNLFSVIDSGYAQMETYGGYNGPGRYVNWARFQDNSSGNDFVVYASHFVARVGPNADSAVIGQYRHADSMVKLMNLHSPLNIPLITAGDFNADSSSAVMQFLQHQIPVTFNSTTITNPVNLDDSWYVANPTDKKPGTVGMGMTAIDWILTTPDTDVTGALIDDKGKNPGGDFPSDHRPLVITFNLSVNTSSGELSDLARLNVYPNPVDNYVRFDLNSQKPGKLTVLIYDVAGRLVSKAGKSVYEFESGSFKMNLDGLTTGLYFYHLWLDDQVYSGKIIKTGKVN